jgi:hypothetical protein
LAHLRQVWEWEPIRIAADGSYEANQDVIDLGKHDDPPAVIAMIGYCYHGTYPERGDLPAEHHLTMYRLADFYDIPDLRTHPRQIGGVFGANCLIDGAQQS